MLITSLWMAAALSGGQLMPMQDAVMEVQCRELAFSAAAEQRDGDVFETFIHADARFVSAQNHRGPDQVRAAWEPFFEPGGAAIRWWPDNIQVLESGDLALSQGPYEIRSVAEGETQVRHGRFQSVWRRDADAVWWVVFDSGGPSQPGPAPADSPQSGDLPPPECGS